jgi:hypothetical protein
MVIVKVAIIKRRRRVVRIQFADEEPFQNASFPWEANQERSLRGKRGQAALRRLEAALLALPEKRLVADVIEDEDGTVCALGALAKYEHYEGSLVLPSPPDENASDEDWNAWFAQGEDGGEQVEAAMLALAKELNVPRLVAVAIIARNDEGHLRHPEIRYIHMLQWVQRCLKGDVGWLT